MHYFFGATIYRIQPRGSTEVLIETSMGDIVININHPLNNETIDYENPYLDYAVFDSEGQNIQDKINWTEFFYLARPNV